MRIPMQWSRYIVFPFNTPAQVDNCSLRPWWKKFTLQIKLNFEKRHLRLLLPFLEYSTFQNSDGKRKLILRKKNKSSSSKKLSLATFPRRLNLAGLKKFVFQCRDMTFFLAFLGFFGINGNPTRRKGWKLFYLIGLLMYKTMDCTLESEPRQVVLEKIESEKWDM